MDALRTLLIDCAVLFIVGVVVALLGPFGSFAAPLGVRMVYWLGLAYAGFFLYMPVMLVSARLAPRLDLPELPLWLAGCAFASIPMAVLVWTLGFLWGTPRWPTSDQALLHYVNVLVMGTGVSLIFYFLRGRNRAEAPVAPDRPTQPVAAPPPEAEPAAIAPPAPEPEPDPRFLDRLPPHLGRTLFALEMEDHYVRAHTAVGSTLLLMRLRDAEPELHPIDGAQVHRSWWVARDAVAGVRRDGRNLRLVLANGLEAPVARARVDQLRAEGWF
ncbi:MAG: LytTR family DNA-binding domain-containing protein [Pseudomonadota bacterium]